jgi:mRNA interferase RelE/StbE
MGTYQIEWKKSALRELKRLDRQVVPRVVAAVESLSSQPLPSVTF